MAAEQIRPLTGADFEAVVALDARITGQPRRGYFEKRLAAALRHPKRHLQLAVTGAAGLQGFLLARRADGEYGGRDPAVVLETIEVDPAAQRAGRGRQNLAALHVERLETEVAAGDLALLRFLYAFGFRPAQRLPFESAL